MNKFCGVIRLATPYCAQVPLRSALLWVWSVHRCALSCTGSQKNALQTQPYKQMSFFSTRALPYLWQPQEHHVTLSMIIHITRVGGYKKTKLNSLRELFVVSTRKYSNLTTHITQLIWIIQNLESMTYPNSFSTSFDKTWSAQHETRPTKNGLDSLQGSLLYTSLPRLCMIRS